MKTKFFALVIILTLLISQLPLTVFATSSDYLIVGDVSGEVGETVTVEVKATKDLTVDDLMVELTFDENNLSTTNEDITVDKSLKNGDAGVSDGVISMGSYDSNTYTITAGTTLMVVKFKILSAGTNNISTALDSENSETETTYTDTVRSKVEGKAPTVAVTGINLNKTETTILSGRNEQLEATILPEDATNKEIEWSSSNTEVATVEAGLVSAIKKGTATITAKTKDGKFSKTCEVTVECSHTNTSVHEAEASTCLKQGHNEYVKCDDCGEIISGSNKLLPLAEHNYGNLISEKEPIHTSEELKNGVKAHYKCSVCGKLFVDEAGSKKEVTEKELEIVAEHLYEEEWKSNEKSHWKECGCGNIVDLAEHTGGTATCVNKAVCSVCGVEYGEVNPEIHEHTEIRNKKEATTREEGYSGDEYCLDCNKLVKEGEKVAVKVPEIKVEPKEDSKEDKAAAIAFEKTLTKLYANKKDDNFSEETTQKLLDAIYDESVMKIKVITNDAEEDSIKEDIELIKQKVANNSQIGHYFDVKVVLEINGKEEEYIKELEEEISVEMPIPEDLPEVEEGYERKYSVIRVHDGYVTELETKIEDNNIVFSSDKFSTYALAYSDTKKEEKTEETSENTESNKTEETTESNKAEETTTNKEDKNETVKQNETKKVKDTKSNKNISNTKKTKNPKTGDNILLWVALFVISGFSFTANIIWNKKKTNGKHLK